MKFNFRKIASVLTSTVMLSSTLALAAAANFPAPFVKDGSANVAIVYGSTAAPTDFAAVLDINSFLTGELAKQTTTSGGSGSNQQVTGEAFALFTSSSPLLMNSTLNSVRETLTSTDLPVILKDGTLDGDVTATYTQKIVMGSNPVVKFAKQPTDDDDPQAGIAIGTSATTQYVYNATVTFDQNVNFTHADTIGEDLTLFGQKYTVGGATTNTKLVLLKSSTPVSLSSDNNPTANVTVEGKSYTIRLVAASDTAATVEVTDSAGKTESKEITESQSKTVNGLEVGVDTADENNFRLTASILVGSQRVTLQDGNGVKIGSDEDLIDGTNVEFELANGTGTSNTWALGKVIFQSTAKDSDEDAITAGKSFVDPIFGTVKVDFTGLSFNGANDRETIEVANSGNDKMKIKFRSLKGTEAKEVEFAYNKTDSQQRTLLAGTAIDLADSEGDPIIVGENTLVNKSGYVVLANDDEGSLFEVTQITNSSSATASEDELTVKNVLTGETITAKADTEGQGTISAVGKSFTYKYYGAQTVSNSKAMQVRFNSPDTAGQSVMLFPTITTKKGAKVAFYEPLNLSLDNWDGDGNDVASYSFPDGDGYTVATITISPHGGGISNSSAFNLTVGSTTSLVNATQSATATIGKLTYNFTTTGTVNSGVNRTQIYLLSPEGGNIVRPAVVLFEEKDDANNYEAAVVTLDAGYDGDSAGLGVLDVVRTVENDAGTNFGNEIQHENDTDLYSDTDLWGSIFTLDKGDSDQTTAKISYPDDQVEALVYVAEQTASITSSGSSSGSVQVLGSVAVSDNEVAQVSNKNLVVVGGSCINKVAADLLGSATPLCGADFEAKTGVGAGSFLIQTFSRTGGNVATLVAGYNAADTTNAAKYITTQTVDTSVGKKYKGTTATQATMVTEASA